MSEYDDTSTEDYAVEESYDSEPVKTWDDGELGESDVIEAADHEGFTSVSEYVSGTNAHDPDA